MPITVTSLMIATHLGILMMIFAMLYFKRNMLESVLAVLFTATVLVSKGFGLVGLGLVNSEFLVAYTVGFIILATLIFLINQTVVNLVKEYSGTLLKIMIIVLVFLSMYILSIDIKPQNSIFDADKIIITMIVMFSIIALALFAYLISQAKDKLPITISAIIFFSTSGVLFIAQPRIPWLVYALIFNFLLFVIEGVIIYYSTKLQSKGLMILGILFFPLHVVTRYFDLLWDLLSGSFLFIVTALLIFLGGYLIDRQRKKVILKKEA